MIDTSIYNITDRVKDAPTQDNIAVAYHEAAHAVMAARYPKYFYVKKLTIRGAAGLFTAKEIEEDYWPYAKAIADIKIALSGHIGEKLLIGEGSRGCEVDLEGARTTAYNLFCRVGYSSAWETLPRVGNQTRRETEIKRRKVEKKIERLLRQCEKEATKYLKKHQQEVKRLGELLFTKKRLKSSQIIEILAQNDKIK